MKQSIEQINNILGIKNNISGLSDLENRLNINIEKVISIAREMWITWKQNKDIIDTITIEILINGYVHTTEKTQKGFYYALIWEKIENYVIQNMHLQWLWDFEFEDSLSEAKILLFEILEKYDTDKDYCWSLYKMIKNSLMKIKNKKEMSKAVKLPGTYLKVKSEYKKAYLTLYPNSSSIEYDVLALKYAIENKKISVTPENYASIIDQMFNNQNMIVSLNEFVDHSSNDYWDFESWADDNFWEDSMEELKNKISYETIYKECDWIFNNLNDLQYFSFTYRYSSTPILRAKLFKVKVWKDGDITEMKIYANDEQWAVLKIPKNYTILSPLDEISNTVESVELVFNHGPESLEYASNYFGKKIDHTTVNKYFDPHKEMIINAIEKKFWKEKEYCL